MWDWLRICDFCHALYPLNEIRRELGISIPSRAGLVLNYRSTFKLVPHGAVPHI